MSENAKKNLDSISDKLKELPEDILEQYAARMDGFAEGFAAGKAHAIHSAEKEEQ
jgi:hypothetical protein